MPKETTDVAFGTVVTSGKTLSALLAIRQADLLHELYGQVAISRSNYNAIDSPRLEQTGDWLLVVEDRPDQEIPTRCAGATPLEAATLQLAQSVSASIVLLEGETKERAKFARFKSEGAVSILVTAHRQGLLNAVRPMIKALIALGHEDVLPPLEMLEALYEALDRME
jgi:predicted nucleic acid-binding protein